MGELWYTLLQDRDLPPSKRKRFLRAYIYDRAAGRCEYCNVQGFECKSGYYIEVHHLDGDNSNDTPENCIGLCATCHRRVHHDIARTRIAADMKAIVGALLT